MPTLSLGEIMVRSTLMVIWHAAPTEFERIYFVKAWKSKIGDESTAVEHALMLAEAETLDEE